MPFNGLFQYPNALLVESANFVVTHATSYSANSGDVVIHATNSTGGASTAAIALTLPPVTQGGPVTFKETSTVGTATILAYETSGVFIDGTPGTTGVTFNFVGDVTYSSDGSNWWSVALHEPGRGLFQYPNAALISSSNFTVQNGTVYSASTGDVVIHATNSTGGAATAAITVTLPAVTSGGPVTIKQTATVGTILVKSLETSGVFIDGTAGTTGVSINTVSEATYGSDGSNWWKVGS